MIELIHSSHCVYHCDYHLVIVTKYRKPVFNEGIFAYFKLKLAGISDHHPVIRIKQVNHDKDHLHLLVTIPPTIAVGKVVGLIKQNTARELKQKFPFLKQIYWGTDAIWSEGYFVSTVGVDQQVIMKYIEQQGKKDSGQTKFEID
ncbi:IS200/IS605 family transposase [Candidatus Gottesmanbacteria bacterium]|nr:IS200/IS605 family transposase [Candidatus Gottesmanbacteria bacterium]